MDMKSRIGLVLVCWAVFGAAQAALHDRGRGLIYDDVLNITWTQNANLPASLSLGVEMSADGRMTLEKAQEWIAALNAVRYGGYDGWRLPRGLPINGEYYIHGLSMYYPYKLSASGDHDDGWNISAPGSDYPGSTAHEIPYMYYNNLGNGAWYDRYYHRNFDKCPDTPSSCLQNTGSFANIEAVYWVEFPLRSTMGLPAELAPEFSMWGGAQGFTTEDQYLFVWPVRDGDVALVTAETAKSIPTFGWPGWIGVSFGVLAIGWRRFASLRKNGVAVS